MNGVSPLLDELRRRAGFDGSHDRDVLFPGQPLVASIWSDAPDAAPESLVPFVSPVVENGRARDWVLTSDVIAIADVSVPGRYSQWRSTWMSAWMLEPDTSLRRLLALASESFADEELTQWCTSIEAALASDRGCVVDDGDLAALRAQSEQLRDLVRERDESGYGIVDATPGRSASGLAYGWSSYGGPELVASNSDMQVWMTPDRGLVVTIADPRGSGRRLDIDVTEMTIVDDVVVVESTDATWELSSKTARPLAWLVPGALRWRVRKVPEVIVWSKTLSLLPECIDLAREQGRPVWLGSPPRWAGPDDM
jgi:hypothetical protein